VSSSERLEVCASAAHHRLVVIVAQRIIVGELAEIRRVAGAHVVKAHRNGSLVGAGRRIAAVLRSLAGSFGYPDEEIVRAAVDLLPHLEEAVHRITDRHGVVDVFGDLKGAIRQKWWKALVGDIARQSERVGGSRPRQLAISADDRRRYLVGVMHLGAALCRFCKLRPRAAVTIDDTLRQQIAYCGARFRPVGAEKVVEADVLSDDDDQVLNRRRCFWRRLRCRRGAQRRR
jgi:hypothetical protein